MDAMIIIDAYFVFAAIGLVAITVIVFWRG